MRQAAAPKKPVRVLIVDDSKVVRASIGKILNEVAAQVKIVGYAEDGKSALEALDVCDPDIVILDLAMPGMNGITALPLILQKRPHIRVVVCSSLTTQGAEMSVMAMSLGAADCVPKPVGTKNSKAIAEFKTALTNAVLGLSEKLQQQSAPAGPVSSGIITEMANFQPRIVAIGGSTGGPNALISLFREMGPVPVPVVITQHMMEIFTAILARQIKQETGIDCYEGQEGMLLEPSKVYLAAGGKHMMLKRSGRGVAIRLDDGPPENFCKPSADAMIRSAVEVYGADVLGIILTGMGKDGLAGCDAIAKAGGRVLVQDQETSIVWGMPGSVANAGLATAILPVSGIARTVRGLFDEPDLPQGVP